MENDKKIEKLKQVLAQKDAVLFIGSGISLWAGLPSWAGFVEELAQFVEESGANAKLIRVECQKGDLLQAASYGFEKLTKQQFAEFMRKVCRFGMAEPQEIHRKLVSMGPRCFITTNFDNLIEEALRRWQPDQFFPPPVTNRNLTGTAEIVAASASNFIFKPHGEVSDPESIILTRLQYRELMPQGERYKALESMKILLVTRPVVYLGFGLRDPDFGYLRDILANVYKGATRDHYAIMPDISDQEVDHWRENYGIHLVGYKTIERADSTKDHNALLRLLDALQTPASLGTASALPSEVAQQKTILALARHAGRLSRAPKKDPEFPIRVSLDEKARSKEKFYSPDKFDYCPVEKFLDEGPERAVLIGLPGAGKTYALCRAAARLAEKLHETCLSEPFEEKNVVIPILVDLKLYKGNLCDLINKALPNGLSLEELIRHFKVKILLDSFNEMPRDYWETGSYELDFAQFVTKIHSASLIIGSRTNDGLSKLALPSYRLDQIDGEFVKAELQRLKIDIQGRFQQEVRSLLRKPFYFQLVASRTISLPKEVHPRDFYQIYFNELKKSFEMRFGKPLDIERALSVAAYEAINRGEEAQPLVEFQQILNRHLQEAKIEEISAQEIANWLVSKSFLIPYTGARIAFFHQSVTEYLAANELARCFQKNPQIIKEKLSLTRWDQALFLTLSLLPSDQASSFLQAVIETDFALALNASKYLEAGRDEVVTKLLSEIPKHSKRPSISEREIMHALAGVSLAEIHEPLLREIMKKGDSIGAVAVGRLVRMKGESIKNELIESLLECRGDYNYCCNGIGIVLRPFIVLEDVKKMVAMADQIQKEILSCENKNEEEDVDGFISGCGGLLEDVDISIIKDVFFDGLPSSTLPSVRSGILCHLLWKRRSTAALELAAELLLRGVNEAATAIDFIQRNCEPIDNISWAVFNENHIERILTIIRKDNKAWGLQALMSICQARPDIAEAIELRASKESGLLKATLLYCVYPKDEKIIMGALIELLSMTEQQRSEEPLYLLGQVQINWQGHEDLLLRFLKLRNTKMALILLSGIYPKFAIGEFEIGPIEWWLEWLHAEKNSDRGYWFKYQMGMLFAKCLCREKRNEFVTEFNKPDSKFRRVIADFILIPQSDLTIDHFSEDAISFLLADLNKSTHYNFQGSLLGNTATETFVNERLLPLLNVAKEPLLIKNLKEILREAGVRHGRRYITR